MKKILLLAFGAVVLTGLYLHEAKKRRERLRAQAQKPRPTGYTPGRGSVATEPDWASPFDMNYADEVRRWLAPRKIIEPDSARAASLAERIYLARGDWYQDDDEAEIEQVFARELTDGIELALVSRKFYWLYRTDLWDFLTGYLSESELESYVSAPVSILPPYRILNP